MAKVTQTQTQTVTTTENGGPPTSPSSLREAIRMGLDEAKAKNHSEYLTILDIEGKIRDLIVLVFPQHADDIQSLIMSWFTRVTDR